MTERSGLRVGRVDRYGVSAGFDAKRVLAAEVTDD